MKPIFVDMYTDKSYVYEFAKPAPASEFYPEWWMSIGKSIKDGAIDKPTIKSCEGFVAQYRNGVILPMWSDLMLEVAPLGSTGYRWTYSDGLSNIQVHPVEQRGSYLPETAYQHLKLEAPWVFRCDEDISFQWLQPMWNFDAPEAVLIPPGIVNFKYQFGVNINMFLKRSHSPREVLIEHGQPLVHLIPLTERKVIFRAHLVTNDEIRALASLRTSIKFIGTYRKVKSLLSRCPFGG